MFLPLSLTWNDINRSPSPVSFIPGTHRRVHERSCIKNIDFTPQRGDKTENSAEITRSDDRDGFRDSPYPWRETERYFFFPLPLASTLLCYNLRYISCLIT